MLLQLIEFALIVLLLVVSWRIVTRDLATHAVGLARWTVSLIAGVTSVVATVGLLQTVVGNFVLRLLLADAAGFVVFWLAAAWLRRLGRRQQWNEQCTVALGLPPWIDLSTRFGLLLLFWLAMLIVFDLSGRVIQTNPQLRAAARNTHVLQWFVPPDPSADRSLPMAADAFANTDVWRVQQAMATQSEFFRRFQQGTKQSKEELYRAIGADEFLALIEAVQEIVDLPAADKQWLLEQNPPLLHLIDHPAMQRIVRNEDLIVLLEQVAAGSLTAIYQIGDDEDVRQLLEDPKLRDCLQQIDPLEMLRQLRAHRRALGQ